MVAVAAEEEAAAGVVAAELVEGAEVGVVAGIPDRASSLSVTAFNFSSKSCPICALIDWALRSSRRRSLSSICRSLSCWTYISNRSWRG